MKFVTMVLVGAWSCLVAGDAAAQALKASPSWDRAANIKEMATHIGNVQRRQGADKALAFIDACYRTHSLGSVYSKAFEGCIVADYLLAQALVAVIKRVPADDLRKTGMATASDIIQAVNIRVSTAFGQYGLAASEANAFVALTVEHGMAPFLKAVFPNAEAAASEKK